jgi:hypothetical protein
LVIVWNYSINYATGLSFITFKLKISLILYKKSKLAKILIHLLNKLNFLLNSFLAYNPFKSYFIKFLDILNQSKFDSKEKRKPIINYKLSGLFFIKCNISHKNSSSYSLIFIYLHLKNKNNNIIHNKILNKFL